MKNYLWAIYALLILTLFSASCTKNEALQPPVQQPFSTVLQQVYEIDSTRIPPNDTITRWTYLYDNLGRVISDSISSSVVYNANIYYDIKKFSYTGSDSFASQMIQTQRAGINFISADTTFYNFANGKYISDSVIYYYGTNAPSGTSNTYFTYVPGIVIRNFSNAAPQLSYTSTEINTIHQTISNGNIISQMDTTYSTSNGQFSGSQVFATSISYLPNPNPFYKVNSASQKPYIYQVGIGNFISTSNAYVPRQLIAQQVSTFETVSYSYTFRADGYPTGATVLANDGTKTKQTKLLFVYSK